MSRMIKVERLTGTALDWAVAKAICPQSMGEAWMQGWLSGGSPSISWKIGGPLIERYRVGLSYIGDEWLATAEETNHGAGACECGDTQLVAAMRAIICERLGDEIEIPSDMTLEGEA